MASNFRDLKVYREACSLADETRRSVGAWSSLDRWTLGVQLVRSVDSVGANIAEGFGRGRHPDQRRCLLIARGSAYEVEHWLARASARDLWVPLDAESRADEISKMLNGLIRSLSTQHSALNTG